MRERNFWTYNIIGSLIWATSINLLWIYFIDNYEVILDNFGKIAMGLIIAFGIYVYFFRRQSWIDYMRAKETEILEKQMKKYPKNLP